MIKTAHLESYKVTLTAVTPVNVGSGAEISKTEYMYNPGEKTVSMINMEMFMKAVVDKGIIDEYERLVLTGEYKGGMFEFLHKFFGDDEISALTVYTCGAEVYDEKQRLMTVRGFLRMANGAPYIAGSSLKGALATCLIVNRIMKNRKDAEDIFKHLYDGVKENDFAERAAEKRASEKIGTAYINTLRLKKNRFGEYSDAVNSEMRALSVSDSAPINASEAMTLCRKFDIGTKSGWVNKVNLLRECIKPETEVTFNITFDGRIKGITFDELKEAITNFSSYYDGLLKEKFAYPSGAFRPSYINRLLIGGGAGYFFKTFTYAAQPYDEALKTARYIMEREFPRHYHNNDSIISPHMVKFTEYNGKMMPMGLCDIRFE